MRLFELPDGYLDERERVNLAAPPFDLELSLGGYNFYRGVGSADAIDYETAVGFAPPGSGTVDLTALGHVAYTDYYYGIRTVSSASVEETNTDRVVRVMIDDQGELISDPPNALLWATAKAAADGGVKVAFSYSNANERGEATGVQVARVTAGVADWDSILQTIAISGSATRQVVLDDTFFDGETVCLAMRAVTELGVGGPATELAAVTATSVGPPAVPYVEAAQV